jgi:hypothetical protein
MGWIPLPGGAWNVPLQWDDPNGGTRSVGSGVLAGLPGLLGRNGMRPSKRLFYKGGHPFQRAFFSSSWIRSR